MYALILAVGKVVLDCELKLSPQLVNRVALKADDGPNAENADRKNVVVLVIIDASGNLATSDTRQSGNLSFYRGYSILMFASLATFDHFAISALINCANSARVPTASTKPSASNLSLEV